VAAAPGGSAARSGEESVEFGQGGRRSGLRRGRPRIREFRWADWDEQAERKCESGARTSSTSPFFLFSFSLFSFRDGDYSDSWAEHERENGRMGRPAVCASILAVAARPVRAPSRSSLALPPARTRGSRRQGAAGDEPPWKPTALPARRRVLLPSPPTGQRVDPATSGLRRGGDGEWTVVIADR